MSGARVRFDRWPPAGRANLARTAVAGLLLGAVLARPAAGAPSIGAPDRLDARTPAGGLAPPRADALSLATALAQIGPRTRGGETHQAARQLLLGAMTEAGLVEVAERVEATATELRNLTGLLPGSSGLEIVLTAHYDTVAGSPGASDDAAGCGVVLAAVADLARTPRRHAVRVVLFDAEEEDLMGSRAWLSGRARQELDGILANLNLDLLGRPDRRPVIHAFPVDAAAGRRRTPGWLVHAVLRGAEAAGVAVRVGDQRFSTLAQLVLRGGRLYYAADSDSFLENGVPSVLLSDLSLWGSEPGYHTPADGAATLDAASLEEWSRLLAATVRRLDALEGRPRPDAEYLVVGGRVWARRDLYWLGFGVWALLVWRGVPGGWRGADAATRRRRGRTYLPGFAFRMLFLLAVFLTPVFAAVLLLPCGLLAAMPRRGPFVRGWGTAIAALPAVVFVTALVSAAAGGWLTPDRSLAGPLLLVGGTLVLFAVRAVAPVAPGAESGGPPTASGPSTPPDASPGRP